VIPAKDLLQGAMTLAIDGAVFILILSKEVR
jgi:hypothetical protein